jgi:L-iditol 2-dehydrogenase
VLLRPGELALEERPVPRPGPGQVVVRVSSVGVCGSDTHYYEHGRIGRFVVESPLVLGHEAAGEVSGVGAGVTSLAVGQRVSIEPGVPDLTCPQCLAGRYNLCPAMQFFATPPVDGALAEYVVVHEAFAHAVPDSIGDDAAALLEPLSVAIWACRKGRVTAGSRVLVTGAGPIGLLGVQVALAFGATEVIVSDISPDRLAVAEEMGATAVVDPREGGLAGLREPPEILLECSGHPPAITEAIGALDRAGRAVLVGMGGNEVLVPLSVVQERELEITGTFRYAGTWPTGIALVDAGRVDLDRLVTGSYRLDQAADALTAGRRDPRSLKAVIHPQT